MKKIERTKAGGFQFSLSKIIFRFQYMEISKYLKPRINQAANMVSQYCFVKCCPLVIALQNRYTKKRSLILKQINIL